MLLCVVADPPIPAEATARERHEGFEGSAEQLEALDSSTVPAGVPGRM